MSTPTLKRPPPASGARSTSGATTTNSTATTSHRSPSRPNNTPSTAATAAATVPTPTNGLTRNRSVRTGTPVSARAAVRKPATADLSVDDDSRAEMQARVDELSERLQQAERAHAEAQRQLAGLQLQRDDARRDQAGLEESLHEQAERIDTLEAERREHARARREWEQMGEAERAAARREKDDAAVREHDLHAAMQRLKETLAQREMRAAAADDDRKPTLARQSSSLARSRTRSPNPDARERQFAPPAPASASSIERSDSASRSSSSAKLILQKDKLIESLRLELAEAQIKLVEMENMGGGRLQELQRQLYELKMQNARLMEENESFQLLLSEKTLSGDFLRPPSVGSRPTSSSRANLDDASSTILGAGATLADELEDSHIDDSELVASGNAAAEDTRRLQAEVQSVKDQNKALTLYINNIISRLLQHEQFEQILDKTPDLMAGPGAASRKHGAETAAAAAQQQQQQQHHGLPPAMEKELPPPPAVETEDLSGVHENAAEVEATTTTTTMAAAAASTATGFLQRARSVIGGTAGPRAGNRPRPQSQIFSSSSSSAAATVASESRSALPSSHSDHQQHPQAQPRLTENPHTAPSVPLARSQSGRHASGGPHHHRRANSEWPAASLVTNMYRPAPAVSPLSPGLGSPTRVGPGSGGFFALHRAPSSGSVVPATIAERDGNSGAAATDKENHIPPRLPGQQRDSKFGPGGVEQPPSHYAHARVSGVFDPSTSHDISSLDASVASAPAPSTTINGGSSSSTPSSPPRSIASSSGDFKPGAGGGAIMMGSKMRPLRLVQENANAEAMAAANGASASGGGSNRGSWFGWMNKGSMASAPASAGQNAQQNAALGSPGLGGFGAPD